MGGTGVPVGLCVTRFERKNSPKIWFSRKNPEKCPLTEEQGAYRNPIVRKVHPMSRNYHRIDQDRLRLTPEGLQEYRCHDCQEWKPRHEHYRHVRGNGKVRFAVRCIPCRQRYAVAGKRGPTWLSLRLDCIAKSATETSPASTSLCMAGATPSATNAGIWLLSCAGRGKNPSGRNLTSI